MDAGQVAVILGNSAVVNSSSGQLLATGSLDAMRLNWGPYLWMRCYNNGAQFLDHIVGANPHWDDLEMLGRHVPFSRLRGKVGSARPEQAERVSPDPPRSQLKYRKQPHAK